jgi:hypothetical protein
MSALGAKVKAMLTHQERHGGGRCYICGDRAIWRAKVKVGRHDEIHWLCEPHRVEFAPRGHEVRRQSADQSGSNE